MLAASRRPQVALPQSVIRRFQKAGGSVRGWRPAGRPCELTRTPRPRSPRRRAQRRTEKRRSFVPVVQSRVGRAREFGPVSLQTGGLVPRPRDSLIQTDFTSTPSASYQAADPVTDRDAKAQAPRGGAARTQRPRVCPRTSTEAPAPTLALCEVARPRAASAAFWSAFWPAAEAGSAEPAPCLAAAASRPAAPGGPAAQPPELHRLPDAVLPPVQLRPACPGHRGGDGYVRSRHVL